MGRFGWAFGAWAPAPPGRAVRPASRNRSLLTGEVGSWRTQTQTRVGAPTHQRSVCCAAQAGASWGNGGSRALLFAERFRLLGALVRRSAGPALDDLPKGSQAMFSAGEGSGDEEVEGTSELQNQAHPGRVQIRNCSSYDRALIRRGDLTIWLSPRVVTTWLAMPSGKSGGQRHDSEFAIEAALTVRLVFGLPWRQTEGLLNSMPGPRAQPDGL